MHQQYTNELEGQQDFLKTYLPRVDHTLTPESIQQDYTDGVVRGNILEFKLNISDLNAVLFQAIRYLSAMRVKGKPIPANILLVSLNTNEAWLYNSEDYLSAIETTYTGGASVGTTGGFTGQPHKRHFDLDKQSDQDEFIATLRSDKYTPIHLDENCIVGWAMSYYRNFPGANKSDFIDDDLNRGEIRNPDKYKDYIYPYTEKSNERFKYLMDNLNDLIQRIDLGAFYTHPLYAEKALELVREAIARVPEGNDYVIIDRCAGTGNLERAMTDEELSHTIVSTLEYYEYKVLFEELGDKVRHIIPPINSPNNFNRGLVRGADALSEDYINNDIIKRYIDNPQCSIILFENPPYAETTSLEHQRKGEGRKSSQWKNSYAVQQMKQEVKGVATNDLGNAFIWTAFKYYLRQPTDSYIVFSPVKYWKAQHLIDRRFIRGFAFNRRHFHTNTDACIMCALWANEPWNGTEFSVEAIDIVKGQLQHQGMLPVKQLSQRFSDVYYESNTMVGTCDGILIGLNGEEFTNKERSTFTAFYSNEMLGYLVAHSVGFDNPDAKSSLLVAGRYDGHGFFLQKNNYLKKLPMFAASRYITYNRVWTERGRIMKSGDGADSFHRDVRNGHLTQWLLKCLLFTTLEPQNHMRSFTGSDGRQYTCHLSLDGTNGDTIALRDLKALKQGPAEQELISLWQQVLDEAKQTSGYDPSLTYGIYQIKVELNTSYKSATTGKTVYDYPALNGHINTLHERVKSYYLNEIVPVLFKYEFLK